MWVGVPYLGRNMSQSTTVCSCCFVRPCRKQLINFEFIFSGDDQAFYWRTSEDGVFDNVLPFTEFTMTGQDKNEDIMDALSIDESKKPYFTYLVYFVTLAAIKKKNFEATKVSFQIAIILSHLLN